jgi:hypothetical protein
MKRTCISICWIALLAACTPDFAQPELVYNSYRLVGLPGEYTDLIVNVDVRNRDDRDGDIRKVVYTAIVEGVPSEQMTYTTRFKLPAGSLKTNMDMELRFTTANAVSLLEKLKNGTNLEYRVTGTFDADTVIGEMTLDLDTSGSAVVETDIDDYFRQPGVAVQRVGFAGSTTPVPGSDLNLLIEAILTNNAPQQATFKSATYVVTLEGGLTSKEKTYAPTAFTMAAAGEVGSDVFKNDLPTAFGVTLANAASFNALVGKIGGSVAYTIRGTMTVSADLGDGPFDFVLPLSVSGTAPLVASF